MRYLLVDTNHLANRAVHVIKAVPGSDEWVGQALTIIFQSIRKHFERFNVDHCVMCFDSYSWREAIYETYKENRALDPTNESEKNQRKIAAKKITHRVLDELLVFLRDETNITVLNADGVEADDFIARWTQLHTKADDTHVIVTGDSDFRQLVRNGVDLYDTLANLLYTVDGVFYQDEKHKDGAKLVHRYDRSWKVKVDELGEPVQFDPQWELFQKCVRGDIRDNIKAAYPRVSETRMRKAYLNRGGVEWNNLINATFGKGEIKHSVRELYDRNVHLIDLTQQPAEVVALMDQTIRERTSHSPRQMVQINFDQFCEKHNLSKVAESSVHLVPVLSNAYHA